MDGAFDFDHMPRSQSPGAPDHGAVLQPNHGHVGQRIAAVSGHAGQLVLGKLNGVPVACLQGRVHLYEGVDPQQLRVPTYTLKLIGCEALLLTTAVGSTRLNVGPGELVLVTDHINMQMRNPLIGPNDPIGPRFPSLMDAYDPKIRETFHECAKANDIGLHDGV